MIAIHAKNVKAHYFMTIPLFSHDSAAGKYLPSDNFLPQTDFPIYNSILLLMLYLREKPFDIGLGKGGWGW